MEKNTVIEKVDTFVTVRLMQLRATEKNFFLEFMNVLKYGKGESKQGTDSRRPDTLYWKWIKTQCPQCAGICYLVYFENIIQNVWNT